jgi:hypothetical protein
MDGLDALDLSLGQLEGPEDAQAGARAAANPKTIELADYPQLQQLAWHVQGTSSLSPTEAAALYARQRRRMDLEPLQPQERQSVDVDLLVSNRQGYRELRQLIRRHNSLRALWKDPQHPPKESREPLTDQYGIRAGVIVAGDDGVFNRDLMAKAEEAYGDAIRIDLGKAL